uniref:Uncharacterized protein n=2 Tax=Strongyloides stercoralis TaxID=6248 RepID=A0A0K0EGW6_STRER
MLKYYDENISYLYDNLKMIDINVIKQLINELNDLEDLTTVDYEEIEFTLKTLLPKEIIVPYLKVLSPEKLEHLLTDDVKKYYNQINFAQFLLNEYLEYDIGQRLNEIVRIMMMISFPDINMNDFLEHIMHNKYVILSNNGYQYCCTYIDGIYNQHSLTKKKESTSNIILNFSLFEDILEQSKKINSSNYQNYTIKFNKNIALDSVLQRSLVSMNQLRRKNPYKYDKKEITLEKANTITTSVVNDQVNEIPVENFFSQIKK